MRRKQICPTCRLSVLKEEIKDKSKLWRPPAARGGADRLDGDADGGRRDDEDDDEDDEDGGDGVRVRRRAGLARTNARNEDLRGAQQLNDASSRNNSARPSRASDASRRQRRQDARAAAKNPSSVSKRKRERRRKRAVAILLEAAAEASINTAAARKSAISRAKKAIRYLDDSEPTSAARQLDADQWKSVDDVLLRTRAHVDDALRQLERVQDRLDDDHLWLKNGIDESDDDDEYDEDDADDDDDDNYDGEGGAADGKQTAQAQRGNGSDAGELAEDATAEDDLLAMALAASLEDAPPRKPGVDGAGGGSSSSSSSSSAAVFQQSNAVRSSAGASPATAIPTATENSATPAKATSRDGSARSVALKSPAEVSSEVFSLPETLTTPPPTTTSEPPTPLSASMPNIETPGSTSEYGTSPLAASVGSMSPLTPSQAELEEVRQKRLMRFSLSASSLNVDSEDDANQNNDDCDSKS